MLPFQCMLLIWLTKINKHDIKTHVSDHVYRTKFRETNFYLIYSFTV
jgi:hypothetical protein